MTNQSTNSIAACPSIAQANRIGRQHCKRNALQFASYYNAIALMLCSWNPNKRQAIRDVILSIETEHLVDGFNYGVPARSVAQAIAVDNGLSCRYL